VLIDRKVDVNMRNDTGVLPLEALLKNKKGAEFIKYAKILLKAGTLAMTLTSTRQTMFEIAEEEVTWEYRKGLMKAFLEADLASQPDLTIFTQHVVWAKEWRQACGDLEWKFAKRLGHFHNSYLQPLSETFLECTFIVIAEKLLKTNKD
jgi:hypothetical protein